MRSILAVSALVVSLAVGVVADQAQAPNSGKTVDAIFQAGIQAFQSGKRDVAIEQFRLLVDKRWADLSPKGRHGAATLLMANLVLGGKVDEAAKYGQLLYQKAPGLFSRLSELSNVPASPEVNTLRSSLHYISLQTMKGSGIIYIHNASDEDIVISDSEFDVVYGYKTQKSSFGKLANTKTKPAFPVSPLALKSGHGQIVTSGKATRNALLPVADVITLLACIDRDRTPNWIHLTGQNYSQTLTSLQLRATVMWGKRSYKNTALIDQVGAKVQAPSKD